MLRYRADLRTIAFAAIYFGLTALLFTQRVHGDGSLQGSWLGSLPLYAIAPLFVLTCWFSFFGAVATHNTVHCPVFKQRPLNRLFQIVLTLTYGHPVSAFVPGHNLSHHKHTQTARDVMRTTKVRYRWNLLNGLLFLVHVGPAIMKGENEYYRAMAKRSPVWFRQLMLEFGVLYGAYLVLALIDWRAFLLYVFLPHKYAAWGIITMNLIQHDGTDPRSEWNHSRNFTGKLVNWFTLNNGYHTIHHMQPGLHWSLLPAAHAAEVQPHIHPNLDQPSLLAYLWRTFGWPGKRTTYLGEPMVLAPLEKDERWVPAPNETQGDLGAIA